jgi:hypothetical protein
MVIEYAEGELFNYIVENGRMSEPAARRFFQQMMCAIDYSHRLKVVHRYVPQSGIVSYTCHSISIRLWRESLALGPPTHSFSRFVDGALSGHHSNKAVVSTRDYEFQSLLVVQL